MTSTEDSDLAQQKIDEAVSILRNLDFPRAQQNDRSALALLALLDLQPSNSWEQASDPLLGTIKILNYSGLHYGKPYRENTRESFRDESIAPFVDAGLVLKNPDKPGRATNSSKTAYQIEASALELVRTFGTPRWKANLQAYRSSIESLRSRYAQERAMNRIPVQTDSGEEFFLSPGGQNTLIKQVVDEFRPRFVPSGQVLYVGDTSGKWSFFKKDELEALGIVVSPHQKMPDIVIHDIERNWLVIVEAVTSNGPIDPKRRDELADIFSGSSAGLVLVTAFLSRKAFGQYLSVISWETDVWIAEQPSHLVHFNGERFLGPY